MSIACLGWGSLVWDPRELPVHGPWFRDGPLLPVEFARQSDDGRITLVLCHGAAPLPCLWARFGLESVADAMQALAAREGMRVRPPSRFVGLWPSPEGSGGAIRATIGAWAESRGIDAVIWTDLPPKFAGERGRIPPVDEVIDYLRALQGETRARAEQYVRNAPRQIATAYRRRIEAELGWSPRVF